MPFLPHLVFGQLTLEHDDNMIPMYTVAQPLHRMCTGIANAALSPICSEAF